MTANTPQTHRKRRSSLSGFISFGSIALFLIFAGVFLLAGFLGLAILLLISFIVILLVGARARIVLKGKYPPAGQTVDVGGYKMHLYCQGEGSPTVVMDTGIGDFSLIWALVQPEVAKFTRTCTYDRAGYGWSDVSPKPRTAEVMVEELHTLLSSAGIAGPLVLVGHSFGGLIARLYAHKYPKDVVGMVLVDSAHEQQYLRFPEAITAYIESMSKRMQRSYGFIKLLVRTGILAIYPPLLPTEPNLPKETAEAYRDLRVSDTRFIDTLSSEMQLVEESHAQVRAQQIESLGDMPLVVISHGKPTPMAIKDIELTHHYEHVWQRLQVELSRLSSNGKLLIAEQSSHYVQLDQPELIVDSIKEVLAARGRLDTDESLSVGRGKIKE